MTKPCMKRFPKNSGEAATKNDLLGLSVSSALKKRRTYVLPKFHVTNTHQPPTKETFRHKLINLSKTPQKNKLPSVTFWKNLFLPFWFQMVFTGSSTISGTLGLLEIGFSQSSLQLVPGNSPGWKRKSNEFFGEGNKQNIIQRVLV